MFRVSVVLGFFGMVLGLHMGISQDFTLAPAHAHLLLLGFVTLFLAGLYYRALPEAANTAIAKAHATVAIVGALLFPIALGCMLLGDHGRFEWLVALGAITVLAGMALFVLVVFRNGGKPALAAARGEARGSTKA